MDKDDLDYYFNEYVKSPFENLRSAYQYRKHSKEEAEAIQKMLEHKLGMEDPEGEIPEEAWRHSNWCSGG